MLSQLIDEIRTKYLTEGKQRGRREGEQRGMKRERRKLARKMLSRGYPTEEIVEITGLTADEVEVLQEENG